MDTYVDETNDLEDKGICEQLFHNHLTRRYLFPTITKVHGRETIKQWLQCVNDISMSSFYDYNDVNNNVGLLQGLPVGNMSIVNATDPSKVENIANANNNSPLRYLLGLHNPTTIRMDLVLVPETMGDEEAFVNIAYLQNDSGDDDDDDVFEVEFHVDQISRGNNSRRNLNSILAEHMRCG